MQNIPFKRGSKTTGPSEAVTAHKDGTFKYNLLNRHNDWSYDDKDSDCIR